jgi:hypothetical protein
MSHHCKTDNSKKKKKKNMFNLRKKVYLTQVDMQFK